MAENWFSLAKQWWWEIGPAQQHQNSEPPSLLEVIVHVGKGKELGMSSCGIALK